MQFLFRIIVLLTYLCSALCYAEEELQIKCKEIEDNMSLKAGWYLWQPYQFNKVTNNGFKLVGMDIEILSSLADKIGIGLEFESIEWKEHQLQIESGEKHIAAGATYTQDRAEYAHFSIPYRFEENSLFTLNNNEKDTNFANVRELLSQIRLQNFVLGIVKGFIYTDPQVNLFISDYNNQDIIKEYTTDLDAFSDLLEGKIDGFLADRFAGAAVMLDMKSINKVIEIPIGPKTPIYFMFSKKSVSAELVEKFNEEIGKFKNTSEYKAIIKNYVYPVLLMQTIEADWFYIIGVIGTFAFAISGVAIAAKDNATLFGTLLFAMLPSVGGSIIRDVLINREEVGLFLTPSYMYYIITIVLIGFSSIRLLEYYNKDAQQDESVAKFWDDVLIISDALGQSAFIVTGVAIAIMGRIEPIELWGPFFAFLTANGGGIIRDILRRKNNIMCLGDSLNAEISILWGIIFGIYLDYNSYSPDPKNIQNFVIFVIIGAFISRLVAYYGKIPNLKFRV
ncbi:MAG: transporter substrate-binding domain-containing protein [Rickettsiaceae bacterium]|nr:transporter substrate-binding domain-containing protein [Rickettsiaceae bacterium]